MEFGERRLREHEKILDPNNKECPIQETTILRGASQARDLTKDLATMPGTGMGGPPPTPPTTGQKLVTDIISTSINRGMGAANGSNVPRDTAP
jgi:hypothetical protein